MPNDFFSLRDLRNSRSKNFLDADDIPAMTFEDSLESNTTYLPWRHNEETHHLRRPVAAGKERKNTSTHTKQGHSSIDDFFAKRDRRKNRLEAGRLVPAEVARRILEINAHHSAGDATLDSSDGVQGADAVSVGPADEAADAGGQASALLQVFKPPPDGWDPEADGDGESANDGSWFPGESIQSSRMQEELQISWEEGYSALQARGKGAYLPPQLRQRQNERPRMSENRSYAGGLRSAAGEASAPDIGCLDAFPALGGGAAAGSRSSAAWGTKALR